MEAAELTITQPKEAYLEKIGENNRSNILNVTETIAETMKNKQRTGELRIVGGSVNKPWPRRDIDVLMIINLKGMLGEENLNCLERASLRFSKYKELITSALGKRKDISIEEISPMMDEEFGSPNILKSEGIFTLSKEGCVPIDIVCYPSNSYQQDDKPTILLEKVE